MTASTVVKSPGLFSQLGNYKPRIGKVETGLKPRLIVPLWAERPRIPARAPGIGVRESGLGQESAAGRRTGQRARHWLSPGETASPGRLFAPRKSNNRTFKNAWRPPGGRHECPYRQAGVYVNTTVFRVCVKPGVVMLCRYKPLGSVEASNAMLCSPAEMR